MKGALTRVSGLLPVIWLGCAGLGCEGPGGERSPQTSSFGRPLATEVRPALEAAVELYLRQRGSALRLATDPNERIGGFIGAEALIQLADRGEWSSIFTFGDEAFEAELSGAQGLGRGPSPTPLPPEVRRIHDGDRGGLDAGSCRGCHAQGGADGSGTATQVALFRGDGRHLSTATRRDAPALLGLGYLSLVAREMEAELQGRRATAIRDASDLGRRVTARLRAKGIEFGELSVEPDGTVDTSGVTGISSDLRVRPFGHKGRFAELAPLVDEALAVHLGVQTASRLEGGAPGAHGDGPPADPDDDGISFEASNAQAVLMAIYLSLLPTPEIRPPRRADLALSFARGRILLDTMLCTSCHRPVLRFDDYDLRVTGAGAAPVSYVVDLEIAGLSPVPRALDLGPDDEGFAPEGTPLLLFSDLRRHEMGPELAEDSPELLPDGAGQVEGSVFLTRPLWGLADTAPYLHDGRALTIDEAIRAHGGEAVVSRDAYAQANDEDRGAVNVYLRSLTRAAELVVE